MTFLCKHCEETKHDFERTHCMFRCDFEGCLGCIAEHTMKEHTVKE
jgi:hypothetical protein